MSAETEPTKFDPNNDPAKLARIGTYVGQRLAANTAVEQVEVEGVQVYLYQGFLGGRDCRFQKLMPKRFPPHCIRVQNKKVLERVTAAISIGGTKTLPVSKNA
jgi:hypothetical protein